MRSAPPSDVCSNLAPEVQLATPSPGEHALVALEAAGVGTWSWELQARRFIFDRLTCEHYGLNPEAFSGRVSAVAKVVHPEDLPAVKAHLVCSLEAGHEVELEHRVVRPGVQSIHHLRIRGRVCRDENGRAIRMTGACWDVTDRKTMEDALARERFLLSALAEHIPDKIYFKDKESRFIWISRETLVRFGAEHPEQVHGKTDFDFFLEGHARRAFEDEQRIITTGHPLVNVEEHEVWPGGRENWVSTTKMPLRDANGHIIGTFGVSRDITERKKAEAQLATYANELRRRNEELEEDLDMARELQNALMPRRYPCFPHNSTPEKSALHFSHFFNPSTAVSGDFFDILEVSDHTAGIFICDVMGHGVRAALVAAIIRALIGELKPVADQPGEFLHRLNHKLCEILKQTDVPIFASAFYVVADLAKGELRYANAGHPDPLCVRHESNHAAFAMPLNHEQRGPVLGMFQQATYSAMRSPLSVHDMVLLFTDGLFEVEGAGGQYYDQANLMHFVNRRADLTAGDLCREVLAEVKQFSRDQQFSDDVCLVALEVERLGLS